MNEYVFIGREQGGSEAFIALQGIMEEFNMPLDSKEYIYKEY